MNRRELLKRVAVFPAAIVAVPAEPTPPQEPETKVVLEMDGRELAEFILPHLPGAIRKYGLV